MKTSKQEPVALPNNNVTTETLSSALAQLFGLDMIDADRLADVGRVLGGWQKELIALEKRLQDVEELPRCNAIRIDKDRRCLHRVGKTCPLHGSPPANGRLRPYIRKADVEATNEAMANDNLFYEIAGQVRDKQDEIEGLKGNLARLWYGVIPGCQGSLSGFGENGRNK